MQEGQGEAKHTNNRRIAEEGIGRIKLNIVKELEKLRVKHKYCEDCWYSCPKAEDGCCDKSKGEECICGADQHNAILDSIINHVTIGDLLRRG